MEHSREAPREQHDPGSSGLLAEGTVVLTAAGDPVLGPAHDPLDASLHLPGESPTALDLFTDHETPEFQERGFWPGAVLIVLAGRFGLGESQARAIIHGTSQVSRPVEDLAGRSLLHDTAKQTYLSVLRDRARALGQA